MHLTKIGFNGIPRKFELLSLLQDTRLQLIQRHWVSRVHAMHCKVITTMEYECRTRLLRFVNRTICWGKSLLIGKIDYLIWSRPGPDRK